MRTHATSSNSVPNSVIRGGVSILPQLRCNPSVRTVCCGSKSSFDEDGQSTRPAIKQCCFVCVVCVCVCVCTHAHVFVPSPGTQSGHCSARMSEGRPPTPNVCTNQRRAGQFQRLRLLPPKSPPKQKARQQSSCLRPTRGWLCTALVAERHCHQSHPDGFNPSEGQRQENQLRAYYPLTTRPSAPVTHATRSGGER